MTQHAVSPSSSRLDAGEALRNTLSRVLGTVGALAYWSADAMVSQYIKKPGPLVLA
jgi:hypothetical protein